MDIATLVGILLGLGFTVGGIAMAAIAAGASAAVFVSGSSFIIVFGGMIASVSVAFPLSEVLKLGSAMGAVFKGKDEKLGGLVDEAVELSDVGRKGAADLEKVLKTSEIFSSKMEFRW